MAGNKTCCQLLKDTKFFQNPVKVQYNWKTLTTVESEILIEILIYDLAMESSAKVTKI